MKRLDVCAGYSATVQRRSQKHTGHTLLAETHEIAVVSYAAGQEDPSAGGIRPDPVEQDRIGTLIGTDAVEAHDDNVFRPDIRPHQQFGITGKGLAQEIQRKYGVAVNGKQTRYAGRIDAGFAADNRLDCPSPLLRALPCFPVSTV